MTTPKRAVLLDDPYNDPEAAFMEFRLTYAGPLYATQRDPENNQPAAKPEHKHQLRRAFHHQLRQLWEVTPFLKTGEHSGPSVELRESDYESPAYDIDTLSARHCLYGFNFVPLVTQELDLLCGLDILFLRPDKPGGVVWAGDIDNRLKTLFDALRIPVAQERYADRTPQVDEKPFFCLLEDDKLITKVSVETDQLLEPISNRRDLSDARLVITVRLRPHEMHIGNMQFG